MKMKVQYKTRQREELISFLKAIPGKHITASDISKYFKNVGISIGTTTIYRQMEKLVDEGLVHKYIIDGNSPACFEYVGEDPHSEKEEYFHCKCEKCGDLIHLKCGDLAAVSVHLKNHHHFAINTKRTVFYGLCEDCIKLMESNI